MLQHCARHAFYDMPKNGLLAVASEFGYEVDRHEALPTVLLQLCLAVHPRLTEEEQLALLRRRIPVLGDLEQLLLESDDAKALLQKDDLEELEQQQQQQQESAKAFQHAAVDLATKIKAKKSSSVASSSSRAPKRQRQYPPEVKFSRDIQVAELNAFIPEQCRFGIDRLDRSWRLSAFGRRVLSSLEPLWGRGCS